MAKILYTIVVLSLLTHILLTAPAAAETLPTMLRAENGNFKDL